MTTNCDFYRERRVIVAVCNDYKHMEADIARRIPLRVAKTRSLPIMSYL